MVGDNGLYLLMTRVLRVWSDKCIKQVHKHMTKEMEAHLLPMQHGNGGNKMQKMIKSKLVSSTWEHGNKIAFFIVFHSSSLWFVIGHHGYRLEPLLTFQPNHFNMYAKVLLVKNKFIWKKG